MSPANVPATGLEPVLLTIAKTEFAVGVKEPRLTFSVAPPRLTTPFELTAVLPAAEIVTLKLEPELRRRRSC